MFGDGNFKIDPSEVFPHLSNAPIVEAVINWSARASVEIEPESLRLRLAELLPEYPTCTPITQFFLGAQIELSAKKPLLQSATSGWRGFRLTSRDGYYIFQFNRDGLAFSRLKPYESWDKFSAEARRIWNIFRDLSLPAEVQRLGVRFVNVLAPISDVTRLGNYLTQPPACLEPMQLPLNSFLYQSLYDVPDYPYRINVVRMVQRENLQPDDSFGLILDIDVSTTTPFEPLVEFVDEHLSKMRWLKNKAFTSLITDKARSQFSGNSNAS